MRYLIECTYVYEHPEDNSGIQRVVRNVINNLANVDAEKDQLVPVVIQNGELYQVRGLQDDGSFSWLTKVTKRLSEAQNVLWRRHQHLSMSSVVQSSKFLQRVIHVLYHLALFISQKAYVLSEKLEEASSYTRPVKLTGDDVLVMLDSSWHNDIFTTVERVKAQGVPVISVIYDLIPITHPQFCDDGLVAVFKEWFAWTMKVADRYVCISKTIRDEVKTRVQQDYPDRPDSDFGYFYLGSELDMATKGMPVRAEVQGAVETAKPLYLAVGTIEPRKNHAYLIDAFDILWENDEDVYLCFVGKIGWKCEALIARIKNHPQFGKRFLMYNELNDAELNVCYDHASAVLFSSFVEGFGLPIVEAKQRGVPVLASDIPVFREIGEDRVQYFDLTSAQSLAKLVASNAHKTIKASGWLSWREATQQFIDAIRR